VPSLSNIAGLDDAAADLVRELVSRQLANLFIFDPVAEGEVLGRAIDVALERSLHCFGHISNKYYQRDGRPTFSPFHSGQYCIFLYYLSNTISSRHPEHRSLADRVYYLNKVLNGVDLYHEVEMPAVFFLDHPVGSVMGRANYADFFTFSQNCTVGNNKGAYPRFGEHVSMMSGAKVLGSSEIGSHVILAANSFVKDSSIPPCSIVFGSSPSLVVKRKPLEYFLEATKTFFSGKRWTAEG
jgi:serine O-acetyltransferase